MAIKTKPAFCICTSSFISKSSSIGGDIYGRCSSRSLKISSSFFVPTPKIGFGIICSIAYARIVFILRLFSSAYSSRCVLLRSDRIAQDHRDDASACVSAVWPTSLRCSVEHGLFPLTNIYSLLKISIVLSDKYNLIKARRSISRYL